MVKITIPFRDGGKIELDGSFEEVKAEVEKIDQLFEKLNTAVGQTATIQQESPITITETHDQNQLPIIPVETKKSPSNAIVFLLESPWGKRGKKQEELNEALESNLIYKSRDLISATLSQLVKYNKITRRKEDDGKIYYPAIR